MPDPARLPDWPLLMDRPTAQRYLTLTRHEFDAYTLAGLIPPPREHVPGLVRWHRGELDASMARAWNLRQAADEGDQAREADDALKAIAARQAALRAGGAGGRRHVPVLPPQRPQDPASRT